MIIVGLTGSIGMGKTTTANLFADEGIPVHDADAAVHELYAGAAVPIIEANFPNSTKNGKVDRDSLSKQVLGKPEKLKLLQELIHPLVAEHRDSFIELAKMDGANFIILDIPLLFETKSDQICNYTLVVTTTKSEQKRRVMSRKGMTEAKFQKILKLQMPDEDKRKKADFIVNTSVGIEDARKQVQEIIAKLKMAATNA